MSAAHLKNHLNDDLKDHSDADLNSGSRALDPLRFPLHGSRLIEASAGTGKTYTIALLYVRLVLGHGDEQAFDRPLNPPDILVVTFTEAATQELRERIRKRLGETARCFLDSDDKHDDAALALRDTYAQAEWPGCARRLQLAAEWMDESAVSTIHGWCYRMLREHAFDSGSLFLQELATDQQDLISEVVRDYWRRNFYGLNANAAQAVAQSYAGPAQLAQALRPLLAQGDAGFLYGGEITKAPASLTPLLEDAGAWLQECETLHGRARDAWAADGSGAAKVLHDVRGNMHRSTYADRDDDTVFEGWLSALDAWSQGADAPPKIATFGHKRLRLTGKKTASEHPALLAIDAWQDMLEAPPELGAAILLHALREVGCDLEVQKQRRAELGFDDLLIRLDTALRGPGGERLAALIHQQFPVAMIDEFQDTDPVQYRIFDTIYRVKESPADRGLFLIGDPKQAIYSFRGADINTYLRARFATEGRHYTLATNYRSTSTMVDAVNQVFAMAETHPRGAFRFRSDGDDSVPFVTVAAQGRKDTLEIDGKPVSALTFWQLPPEGDSDVVGATRYRERMAAHAASSVREWLALAQEGRAGLRDEAGKLSPLRPADIAILVRSGTEAQAIRDALAARELPSVYLSDRDSVFASAQAADVLVWLRACAEPANDLLLRSALATRTLDQDWATLDRLSHDEMFWEEQVMRFRGYHECWQRQGVLPMLRSMLSDFSLPARLLHQPDGERSLTNLLHLAEWLQREAAELDGEHALIRHLAEQLASPSGEEVLRLESDDDLIKVVTIHKSKGLEYPLVLLPFAASWREVGGRGAAPPSYFDPITKGRLVELLRDTKVSKDAYVQADDERQGEDMRLLYVALTRARHATWLGVAPLVSGNAKRNELHKGALGYLLGGGEALDLTQIDEALAKLAARSPAIAIAPAPAITDLSLAPPPVTAPGPARMPVRSCRESWWIASYSALAFDNVLRSGGDAPVADDANAVRLPVVASRRGIEPESAVQALVLEEREQPLQADLGSPGRTQIDDLHRFPRGPAAGTFLHSLLEWAGDETFALAADDGVLREDAIARRANLRGWTHWIPVLDAWLAELLTCPLPLPGGNRMTLASLRTYQVELEFWFASHRVDVQRVDALVAAHTLEGRSRPALAPSLLNGMFKGFIDLSFEYEGRYYVADYKSNWLGENASAYTVAAMRDTVLEARYELQYVIYLLALHRQLKARLPDYDYDEHVGGALCIFLRGTTASSRGVHVERPPAALIHALDELFSGGTA
ncbi:exodeoxyribonuclease V subunit beta [Pigmentiphaga aceris]|uniref:RecBCD enzyme subunit RecB n=1 Tax=Pigmentiphaga aceris TaxID=1940612 RepID=A0A5C0AVW2_9BURK|nr:exodeoxyribonuclease V subunit beta [Pigmentiphaga aceris]QEI05503.1 exodeoxyribonuclease V subunit beta [Pigmentiphaga aceris]